MMNHEVEGRRKKEIAIICMKIKIESRTSKKNYEETMEDQKISAKMDEDPRKMMKNETITNFLANFRHGKEKKKSSRYHVMERKK